MPKKLIATIYPHGVECECDCAAVVRADVRRFDSPYSHDIEAVINGIRFDIKVEHDIDNGVEGLYIRRVEAGIHDATTQEWAAVLRGVFNMYRMPTFRRSID